MATVPGLSSRNMANCHVLPRGSDMDQFRSWHDR
jgi:hypothetical protein